MAEGEPDKPWPNRPSYRCECHVTNNFFVHSVEMHFSYGGDDADFIRSCKDMLPEGGPSIEEVLREVKKQREKRFRSPVEAEERAKKIAANYVPLHKELYTLDAAAMLSPKFVKLVQSCRDAKLKATPALLTSLAGEGLLQRVRCGLYTFPVLTESFCASLEEELQHFLDSGLPHTAPNTMNRYGIIMAELGFGKLLGQLVQEYIDAVATTLLPNHTKGLDSYRAFTVLYDAEAENGDKSLAMHYDNAEVTLNINIGGNWEGGSVAFYGLATELVADDQPPTDIVLQRGQGVFHAGWELHQAQPISTGRRHNLILWCRSSAVRNQCCPMCSLPPRVLPTSYLSDEGFTVPPCKLSSCAGDDDCDLYS